MVQANDLRGLMRGEICLPDVTRSGHSTQLDHFWCLWSYINQLEENHPEWRTIDHSSMELLIFDFGCNGDSKVCLVRNEKREMKPASLTIPSLVIKRLGPLMSL
jgi:hypothetical protein